MKTVILPVIVSILILGVFGFSEDAFAATTQVRSDNCELPPYNGMYDAATNTCTIPGTLTIPAGDEFQVSNLLLKITGTLELSGSLRTGNSDILNEGVINLFSGPQLGNDGAILLFSGSIITNACSGVINLYGGTVESTGSLFPSRFLNLGTVNGFDSDPSISTGIIASLGLVNNYGTINAPVETSNIGAFFDDLPSLCGTDPTTTIDTDTTGDQLVESDDILIITNGATLTGNVSIDGGLLIVEQSASVDGKITSENGGAIQLLENCNVSGNVKPTDSGVFIESCFIGGNLKTTGGFLVIKNDSTVNGNVNVKSADYVFIVDNDNSFNQNVRIEDVDSVRFTRNHVTENLRVVDSGTVWMFSNEVMGNLRSFDNESTRISGNTVTGNLNTRGTDDVEVVSNTVSGDLRVSDSPVRVLAIGNTVGENLRIEDSSNVELGSSLSIGENLRVIGNDVVFVRNSDATNNVNIKDNTDCTFDKITAGNELKIKDCIQIPSITPTGGLVGTPFTILDGLGRMIIPEGCSGVVLFTPTNPSIPPQAVIDPVFSADGMSVSGVVEFANSPAPSEFVNITVHPCDASDEPFFEDELQFFIATGGGL